MTQPVFVESVQTINANTTAPTFDRPTLADGDFVLIWANARTIAASQIPDSIPSGFTQEYWNNTFSQGGEYWILWKRITNAAAEPSQYTFDFAGAESFSLWTEVMRFTGVDPNGSPFDSTGFAALANAANDTTIEIANYTCTEADSIIIATGGQIASDTGYTLPAVSDQAIFNNGWSTGVRGFFGFIETSGAISGQVATLLSGTGTGGSVVFALRGIGVPTETLRPTATRNVTNLTPSTDPSAYQAIDDDPDLGGTDFLTGTDPSGSSASDGPRYPTNAMVNPATGLTAPTWTNGANATDSSDTTTATVAIAATNTDNGSYFSFPTTAFAAIPSNATITAISLEVKHQAGTANRWQSHVQLGTANGSLIGAEKNIGDNTAGSTATLPSTLQTNTVNAFSVMPTRANLVNGTFGFRLRMRRSNTSTYTFYYAKMTVTYDIPGTTVNTKVEAIMGDPTGGLLTGTGTGTIRLQIRKLGGGSNPSVRAEIHENASATVLATPIADTAVSTTAAAGTVLSGTFDQNVITNPANVEVWIIGTGAAGGLIEIGAVEWNAQNTSGTAFSRPLNEAIGVADTIIVNLVRGRQITDTAAVADSVTRLASYQRPLTDTAAVADSVARAAGRNTTINDSAGVADTATRTVGRTRSISDAAAVADTATRVVGRMRAIADAAAVADTLTRQMAAARTITDAAAVADSAVRVASYLRPLNDTVAVADSVTRSIFRLFTRAITDAVAVADSISRLASYQRPVSDAAGVADSVTRALARVRAITDAVSVADTATRQAAYLRPVTDAVGVTDSATRTLLRLVTRTITDAVAVADSVSRVASYQRPVNDTIGVADTATRALARVRTINDTVSAADVLTRTVAYLRAVTDTAAVADSATASKTGIILRTITDAVTVADTATRAQIHRRTQTDTAGVTDTATRTLAAVRAITDAAAVADTVARVVNRVRTITDAAGVADSATRVLFSLIQRTISDAVAVADTVARVAAYKRPVTDTASVADTATRVATYKRPVTDTASVADAVARSAGRTRAVTDTLTVADTVLRSAGRGRTINDALAVADSVTRQAAYVRALADAVAVSDDALAGALVRRAILDAVGVADLVIAFKPPTEILFPPGTRTANVEGLPGGRIGRASEGVRQALVGVGGRTATARRDNARNARPDRRRR